MYKKNSKIYKTWYCIPHSQSHTHDIHKYTHTYMHAHAQTDTHTQIDMQKGCA